MSDAFWQWARARAWIARQLRNRSLMEFCYFAGPVSREEMRVRRSLRRLYAAQWPTPPRDADKP